MNSICLVNYKNSYNKWETVNINFSSKSKAENYVKNKLGTGTETNIFKHSVEVSNINKFVSKFNKAAKTAEGKALGLFELPEVKIDEKYNPFKDWHFNQYADFVLPWSYNNEKEIFVDCSQGITLHFRGFKSLKKIDEFLNINGVNVYKGAGNVLYVVTASSERRWKFSDGSVITASTAEEAKAKHKVMAAQDFGVLDADRSGDKRSQTEMPKSNAMFVIQRKDGTFMTTNTTIKYGHDDVRFVKDINKADIFFYENRAKGIMNFVKKYNPSFEMEVKKLKLSV